MSAVAEWLDGRRPAMPPELRRVVEAALDRVGAEDVDGEDVDTEDVGAGDVLAGDVADRLADAGLAALSRVSGAMPERSTAADLLAADALLTYACEAAAEAGAERLDRLIERLDHARFAALLEPSGP